jgi:predicted nucleic acid-binding protein
MWLLDTVALCEPGKPRPNPSVLEWFSNQYEDELHTSTVCLGEIWYGAERLPPGRQRDLLRSFAERGVEERFGSRLHAFDALAAKAWGEMMIYAGRTLPTADSMIAATALAHDLTVVTRNVRDFGGLGVRVICPWED